jgi:hypothetical protein
MMQVMSSPKKIITRIIVTVVTIDEFVSYIGVDAVSFFGSVVFEETARYYWVVVPSGKRPGLGSQLVL